MSYEKVLEIINRLSVYLGQIRQEELKKGDCPARENEHKIRKVEIKPS